MLLIPLKIPHNKPKDSFFFATLSLALLLSSLARSFFPSYVLSSFIDILFLNTLHHMHYHEDEFVCIYFKFRINVCFILSLVLSSSGRDFGSRLLCRLSLFLLL